MRSLAPARHRAAGSDGAFRVQDDAALGRCRDVNMIDMNNNMINMNNMICVDISKYYIDRGLDACYLIGCDACWTSDASIEGCFVSRLECSPHQSLHVVGTVGSKYMPAMIPCRTLAKGGAWRKDSK